jgi:hypothetical protein
MSLYVPASLLELADQVLIGPSEPADRLAGALGAAAHSTERIRIARNTTSQPDHHQYEGQMVEAVWRRGVDLVDELPPLITSQRPEGSNDPRGKQQFRIRIVHNPLTVASLSWHVTIR